MPKRGNSLETFWSRERCLNRPETAGSINLVLNVLSLEIHLEIRDSTLVQGRKPPHSCSNVNIRSGQINNENIDFHGFIFIHFLFNITSSAANKIIYRWTRITCHVTDESYPGFVLWGFLWKMSIMKGANKFDGFARVSSYNVSSYSSYPSLALLKISDVLYILFLIYKIK